MEPAPPVAVATTDLSTPHSIVGPVFIHLSDKGLLSSIYDKLRKRYEREIDEWNTKRGYVVEDPDWALRYVEATPDPNEMEIAFYIAVQEIRRRAAAMGADTVIGLRQQLAFDPTGNFNSQVYGTAVRTT